MEARRAILGSVFLVLALVVAAVAAPVAVAAPRWSEWSAPVALSALNTEGYEEMNPVISKDGLTLYFSSNRPGGLGGMDLWVSYRASTGADWGEPVNLGAPINTAADELHAALSRDEHWLFLTTNRAGGAGGNDIWRSYRAHAHEDFGDFGWQAPTPVAGINTAANEAGPSYLQDDQSGRSFLFFFSGRPGGLGAADVYVAEEQSDGSFATPTDVTELNTRFMDQCASIRHDGLDVILMSSRGGTYQLWEATRESTTATWSAPVLLTELTSAGYEGHPYLAPDGATLYLTRWTATSSSDLYVSSRTRTTGKP